MKLKAITEWSVRWSTPSNTINELDAEIDNSDVIQIRATTVTAEENPI